MTNLSLISPLSDGLTVSAVDELLGWRRRGPDLRGFVKWVGIELDGDDVRGRLEAAGLVVEEVGSALLVSSPYPPHG